MIIIDLQPSGPDIVDRLGFIPTFLDEDDPRSAIEQFKENYVGGWNEFEGFTLDKESMTLSYEGDPPLDPHSCIQFRNERIWVYPYAWTLVTDAEVSKWEVSRMD